MTFTRANTPSLSRSIRVAASPATVWELITSVARITEWYDSWDAVEPADDEERLQVGTSFRLIRYCVGRDDTALCRVTAAEAPRRLVWLQHAPRLQSMSVEFQLRPDTESATDTWVNHTRTWIKPNQPLS